VLLLLITAAIAIAVAVTVAVAMAVSDFVVIVHWFTLYRGALCRTVSAGAHTFELQRTLSHGVLVGKHTLKPSDLLTLSEAQRIAILNNVKRGRMSIDEALEEVLPSPLPAAAAPPPPPCTAAPGTHTPNPSVSGTCLPNFVRLIVVCLRMPGNAAAASCDHVVCFVYLCAW